MKKDSKYVNFWASSTEELNYFPKYFIIEEKNQIDLVFEKYKNIKEIGFDIETEGLNPDKDEVVGLSFSFSIEEGFYIPFNHFDKQVDISIVRYFFDIIKNNDKILLIYNASFDILFLEEKGIYDFHSIKFFDVMILSFLMDTNIKMPSLKKSVLFYLGIKQITYDEVLGDKINLKNQSVINVLKYVCDDAICVRLLYHKLMPILIKECPFVLKIENSFVRCLIDVKKQKYYIDKEKLLLYKDQLEKRLKFLEVEIYKIAGREFNIASNVQVSGILKSLGIFSNKKTESGAMSVDQEALESLDYPITQYLSEHALLRKQLTTYVNPFLLVTDGFRINYMQFNVQSGRISSGGDKKNPYYLDVNIQGIPKPESKKFFVHKVNENEGVLGYEFNDTSEGAIGKIEGYNQDLNIRSCFKAEDGKYWVSIDFVSQELRIAANLSGEEKWINVFNSGGDIHKRVACDIWGEENYDKDKRKLAKFVSFGILYGGSSFTIAKVANIKQEEANKILEGFYNSNRILMSWIKNIKANCRRTGVSYSYFGYPRRLKYWYSSDNAKDRSYADRVAVNHTIQSTGAGLFKLAVCKVYKKVLQKWGDKIKISAFIHDEIDFMIDKKYIKEIIKDVVNNMEYKDKNFIVPMIVDFNIGDSWGNSFPFIFNEKGDLVPNMEGL